MNKIFVRAPYNYDTDKASLESGFESTEPSMTNQSDAIDADINTIVKRFGLTGQLPPPRDPGQFGDFTEVTDFHSALNAVRSAGLAFMELPADIRESFNNDPARLLEALQLPSERARLEKLGVVNPTPAPLPDNGSKAVSGDSLGS